MLQNAKSAEELEDKINELADAFALTEAKTKAIYTMLLFISRKL